MLSFFFKYIFENLRCFRIILLILFLQTQALCQTLYQFPSKYPDQIGDIYFNNDLDTSKFEPCKTSQIIHWYTYEVKYKGDSKAIYDECINSFIPDSNQQFTGYVIVRFVVNCKGSTGWYRANALTNDYLPADCPKPLLDKLIIVVKNLKNWRNARYDGVNYDAYMYLNFKMIKGRIVNILPLI